MYARAARVRVSGPFLLLCARSGRAPQRLAFLKKNSDDSDPLRSDFRVNQFLILPSGCCCGRSLRARWIRRHMELIGCRRNTSSCCVPDGWQSDDGRRRRACLARPTSAGAAHLIVHFSFRVCLLRALDLSFHLAVYANMIRKQKYNI